MFLLPSLLGMFLFMTPIPYEGNFTIPIAMLKDWLLGLIGDSVKPLVAVVIISSALASIVVKLIKPKAVLQNAFLDGLLNPTPVWFVIRVLAALFVLMITFGFGPEMIKGGSTGAFVFNDLMPTLFAVFLFAGSLLPLLTNFGLLELVGSLLTRVMRPLFNLPGRSAINCLASWLGDGSVGVLMSSKQYEDKLYTQREAAIIGTTFSAVSISFSLVVIAQVGLEDMFVPFYLTVCAAGLVCALIVPRLPPLSNKKDLLIDGSQREFDIEALPAGQNVWQFGYQNALNVAAEVDSLRSVAKMSLKNAVDMVFGVLPVVMAIGTMGLIIAEYTPIFAWLGAPFVPLLELLQIPFAKEASETMVVGFADMFIPSVLASTIDNDMTKFVIAVLSVTQLIFMSEIGALLLGSRVPVKAWELFVIFLLRTLVSLPVIAAAAHLLF
ncbi:nucleoside recognition domain-containing protein [Ferrimonas senticii]|uniref:nucleoside recognition domain-containing protein n=1 Tax=Ferrimonas senticii TaxID=394566 RepID=UPI0004292C33